MSEKSNRLLRVKEVLQIIPISRASWWRGVRDGRYPKPFKLSPRVTVWKLSDIEAIFQDTTE